MFKIKPRILSPTAINTYIACPRKFFLRYIQKCKSKPSIHLIRGTIVHRAIYNFHQNQPDIFKKMPLKMVEHELLAHFDKLWTRAGKLIANLGLSADQVEFYYHDSKRMLKNFSTWFLESKITPGDFFETRIFSRQQHLMGIIDAVHINNGRVKLIDYKTSKKAKVTADMFRQAAIYALLWQDKHDQVPTEVGIQFLTDLGEPKSIFIDEHVLAYGQTLVNAARQKTLTTEKSAYPCKCGGYCERDFT